MNYWSTYQNLFGQSIVEDQFYQKTIQSMLKKVDESKDPCNAYNQLLYLENILKTKSDQCTSIKRIIPFVYNYKDQTSRRSSHFQREAANAYTQCLQHVSNEAQKSKRQHQLNIKKLQQKTKLEIAKLEEQTKLDIAKQHQSTEKQRIQAMKRFKRIEQGVNPQFFRP